LTPLNRYRQVSEARSLEMFVASQLVARLPGLELGGALEDDTLAGMPFTCHHRQYLRTEHGNRRR
jgi:hypothetical protein